MEGSSLPAALGSVPIHPLAVDSEGDEVSKAPCVLSEDAPSDAALVGDADVVEALEQESPTL